MPARRRRTRLPHALRRCDLEPRRPRPIADRFWSMVDRGEDDVCWPWRGRVNKDGFGHFRTWRGTELAHRLAWVLTRGDLPACITLHRSCPSAACVNPTHHEWRRAICRPRAKLTPDAVRAIRAAAAGGATARALALRFGVSRNQVHEIVRRRQWRNVA